MIILRLLFWSFVSVCWTVSIIALVFFNLESGTKQLALFICMFTNIFFLSWTLDVRGSRKKGETA
jgi:hypothetical protein